MTPPPLMTIEEYSTMFKEMICKITEAYEVVPPLVRKFSTSSKRCERQKDLRLQEQALLARSEKIQDVLSLGTAKKLRYKELLRAACYRIYTKLSQLQDCLRNLQLYAENNFRRDGQIVKPDIKSRRAWASWLTNWYEGLIEAFRSYEKATDELIKRQIRPQQPDNSLEQLSSDARTTSQFKKCLCRVCPEGCHNYHTAYLSLEPDNLGNARGISAAGSPTARTEGNPVIIWQCDMAFKSTVTKRDTLIWLKVKSNMNTVSHPPSNIASSLCTSFDNDEASNTELQKPHAIADRPSRKHRASSMPPEPAFKALKTHLGQSHSDTDPAVGIASRIELCPEFLAQHDATEHAVMKMADSSGCEHSIFYLAQEERSMYGAKSITLDELLRSRHEAKHRSFLGGLFSKLRLARVIAEAMLRFDLRDSDRAPEKSIFVHGLSAKRTAGYSVAGLAPFSVDAMKPGLFLAITLEKQQQQCIATVPSAGSLGASSNEGAGKAAGRASVLVNLGMILLRIGTERDDQLDHAPMGSDQMREFISANAEKTQINPLYADAVRACAWFFEDDDVTTDEVFRDRFFSKIVQPLKFCERLILQDREKGRV
ncbi:hypothetical protein F4823DRAFT_614099 [Ustulina deusta]|nr:hypothetical protein F4823DRAFT_614099 [Ustulina deusta]